jgi:hypothetical protein
MRVGLVSVAALAALAAAMAGSAQAGRSTPAAHATAVQRFAAIPHARHTELVLAPRPSDLAIVEVRFPHRLRGTHLFSSTVQASVQGAFGADYMALGVSRVRALPGPQVMLLLANRPSALLDPARVHLQLSTLAALGKPMLRTVEDPLTHPNPARAAALLCDLEAGGRELGRSAFDWLLARGTSPRSLDPSWAISQAYDITCSLPYSSVFLARLAGTTTQCSSGANAQGTLCCPSNAICAPAPTPPTPPAPNPPAPPPGCTPCDPPPGYACPLVVSPSVCPGPPVASGARVAAGAH